MENELSPDALEQTLNLIKRAQIEDSAVQNEVFSKLNELNEYPDFGKYLLYILVNLRNETSTTRSLAGYALKNLIISYNISPDLFQLIRDNLLPCLADDSEDIRRCVGSLIPPIISRIGLRSWPDIFPSLISFAESSNTVLGEGSLSALQKICEDCQDHLRDPELVNSIEIIVPRLIQFTQNSNPIMKVSSLKCLNHFLSCQFPSFKQHVSSLLENLFALNNDENSEVKKQVCSAFRFLVEEFFDDIYSRIYDIIELMIARSQDQSEEVALEACEFWPDMYDKNVRTCILKDYLERLVPILVNGMQYHETDLECLKDDLENNSHIEDRDQDIRPRFHKARGQIDEFEDEEGPIDDEYMRCWTLRKCCASALDNCSKVYGNAILPILLPITDEIIQSSNWRIRESGILVLGAISEGCMMKMCEFLPRLFPFLLRSLQDEKALIRSISCWTISRYAKWVTSPAGKAFFPDLLAEHLKRILDLNKRVQEAACSAFAAIVEEGGSCMVPYLDAIVSTFAHAMDFYKSKNLNLLYDAISRLAESVSHELNKPHYVAVLMTPLCKKWFDMAINDRQIFSLLECISSLALAFGSGFIEYHTVIFARCIDIIREKLTQSQNPISDTSEKDFIVVCLDLLSAICEGLGDAFKPTIHNSELFPLLLKCSKDPNHDVRQSSFALLGDLTKASFEDIQPLLDQFMDVLAENMNLEYISVCNNAIWAVGEISMKQGERMDAYVDSLIIRLITIINNEHVPKTVLENTAITIGRLGFVCANNVAPHLPSFIRKWCTALRNVRDNEQKDSAFRGMCNLVLLNPTGIVTDFVYFCDAVASWSQPPQDLREKFGFILHSFRNEFGRENWDNFWAQTPRLRERLTIIYNV